MMPCQKQAPKIKHLLDFSNAFYQDLHGYKPEQTKLQSIPEKHWKTFCQRTDLNSNSSGIYLPRNQTAIIQNRNPLSLFHEYFGHGLFCEQSLIGRKLVDLEKKLLEDEKQEFQNRKFSLKDLEKFREQNKTFQELKEFRKQNLARYEIFAIWTEYLLSKEFSLRDEFEMKYDFLEKENREAVDSVINFSESYGDLATFYASGLARRTTPERVKKLLEDVYGIEAVNNSKLILLTGSKKPFSDIDLFACSDYLQPTKNSWLDLAVFREENFEERTRLFETQVTHPIMAGEFITGNKNYLQQKRIQLQEQPITKEAIKYNLNLSEEQKQRALEYPEQSEERKTGLSYSETYLKNALALKQGLRLFTKEDLISYSQSERFIELKGGKIE